MDERERTWKLWDRGSEAEVESGLEGGGFSLLRMRGSLSLRIGKGA